jgi:S1-C subfamily serine protease
MDNSSTEQPKMWRQRLQPAIFHARRILPFVSGMLAALVALVLFNLFAPPPEPLTLDQVNEQMIATMAEATPAPAYSSLAYQAILPSLVFIQVRAPGEQGDDGVYRAAGGLGSGVVVNADGDVLTSLHVVTNSTAITLTFADGFGTEGQIVAAQPEKDIAVVRPLKLPPLLVPAVLGSPGSMHIGDEAYAVGHPFGLYASMTTGVISGFERTFRMQNSEQRLEGLIQIDAAVNPGNSGGPLLNRYGQVVGIVTGLANPTDESFFVGIGFAVPIDVAGGAAGLPPW